MKMMNCKTCGRFVGRNTSSNMFIRWYCKKCYGVPTQENLRKAYEKFKSELTEPAPRDTMFISRECLETIRNWGL